VCCHDATATSFAAKVRGEVFAYFHAVAVNVTAVCGIDCLACQDIFFVNNPLNVKQNDEHALYFALHLSCLFYSLGGFRYPWRIWTSVHSSCFLP
jgi:hypothetical protein